MIVYLAGLISTTHTESLEWREEVAYQLSRWSKPATPITALSPVRGKNIATSKDGGVTVDSSEGTSKDCILRDYNDVQRAGVMLVNLNTWGSKRPMVGTLMELAWAWQMKLPVVAVCDKDDSLMRNHPFVKECVSHYYETMDEAIEFIRRYYA